ncbi:GNAT family N-acetyltransferase [Lentibacter algarum]|uniref:GNAT family N-acetyltransferase n=1 Tax=Lentibacter algarum TaxID=576131 RepID=UPI001C0A4424|nr:GNAT family N-acetyltransferase [Lentibacter algarum]MBU2982404.1 GNAT family N-acetyltransferase [Lentibacter algarum]
MNVEINAKQMVIAADGFVLRPLEASDAALIELYAADARVAKNTTTIPHPLPPGATEALIARVQAADRQEDTWAMDGSADGGPTLLGLISLKRMDRNQSEIGYWVAPAFWNTGHASAGVAALLQANPHADDTIFASVFQDNPASARVLTNQGFAYIGDAESFSVARGVTVPTWTYICKLK